jgi:uncharacterized protein YjbI with pentapeptide repeats/beta-lactamase regulating signal transducer with metallopeptidase domain
VLEAIVGVAVYAVVASIVLGAILAACVFVATRALALTAATRHLLWTIALVATGLMPFLAIGTSLSHATAAVPMKVTPDIVTRSTDYTPMQRATPPQPHPAAPATHAAPAVANDVPLPVMAFAFFRCIVASSTPTLSRNVALGLIAVWLVGAAIGLGSLLGSLLRVRGLRRRSSPLDSPLADELPWLTEVGPGREIYLRLSYEIETPVAIGFRRPVILIPTELATSDGLAAIEQLVLHEYAHLRRYDDWTNLFQRTIERLLWFNPIVWLVGRRIALEREIASDDAVVERTGAPHRYATSLWKLAREMRMPEHAVVAPGALLTRKQISVRIERLLDKNRARLHRSPAAALAITLAGCAAVALVATAAPAVELPSAAAMAAVAAPPTAVHAAQQTMHAAHAASVRLAQPAAHAVTERVAGAPAHPQPLTAARVLPVPHLAPLPHVAPVIVRVPVALPSGHAVPSGDSIKAMAIQLAEDVQESIHESLPRRVADDDPETDHQRLDGMRLSRELIGACVGCSMRGADLHGLDLHDLTLNGDDLGGADLHGANLAGAKLIGVSLRNANLSGANLSGASLNGVELRGATFDGAQLDGVRLIGVELREVSLRGTALRSVVGNCVGCDLHGLDLHGQDLHGIKLSGADLRGANLSGANLHGVHFSGVDLSHANLAGADLSYAHLDGCDLSSTNLSGAQTTGLHLSGTTLGE